MATLADLVASYARTPSATVRLSGRRCTGVLRISKQEAFGRGPASATVELRNPPVTPVGGMPISVSWGYNGVEVPGFTGYVTVPNDSSYPDTWSLECQDVLWLPSREQRPIVTSPLNSITAQAAIEYILSAYGGNPRKQIPAIKRPSDSGSNWTLGQLTPVSWDKTTALSAIQDIAGTAGWWIYADAGGTVRGVLIERRPSDSPFRTFQRGVDLLIDGAPKKRSDWSQIKNRMTVRGAATGVEGAQLYDTFLATHALSPGVVADQAFSFFLLEYEADVTAVAERLAGIWNRRPNTIDARIKADPRLKVGMTVAIKDSGIDYANAVPFFIYSIQTTLDLHAGKFDQVITLDGGTGSAGYSLIPAPVAVITYTLEQETLDGTAITIVHCDGSGSYSLSEGEIVGYAWATTDTPYSGTANSGSGVTFTFVLEDSSAPFDISLTVTDTSSKTDTATVSIPLSGDAVAPALESVHAAGGSAWSATGDGGANWRDETRTTTIVAEAAGVWDTAPTSDNATYGALATSTAQVRQTLDLLASASTLLSTAGGTITALYTNARNGSRVWRAVGTTVQRSVDGGTTWASWSTAASAAVRQIIEDPALDNSVFVLAGADMLHNTGSGWSVLYAGPTGATARWMVRSESGDVTWICYTGTFTGEPLQRVEGAIAAAWTGATAPTEIQAIALNDGFAPLAPQIVAIDPDGQTWIGSAADGAMTAGPTLPTGAVAQHATASRKAPIVYIADFDSVTPGTTGALRKLLVTNGNVALFPWRLGPSGAQYHMVQLAGEARPVSYTLLVGTAGLTPGGIYKRDLSGVWTLTNSGLPSGWDWEGISANPFSDQEWIAIGRPAGSTADTVTTSSAPYHVQIDGTGLSPFWLTMDGGATYTEYVVDSGARGYANVAISLDNRRAIYTSQGAIAVMVELAEDIIGNVFFDIWRGGTQVIHEDVGTRPNGFNSSGTGGDLLVTYSDSAGTTFKRGYVPGGGSSLTGFTTTSFYNNLFRNAGASPAAFTISGTTVLRWDDYRASGSPTTIASGLTGLINMRALADAVYVIANANVVQIDNPTGSPTVTTVFSGGYDSNMGRSDQGAQQFLLVRAGTTLQVWDGTTWTPIAAPPGLISTDMQALGIIDEGSL